MKNYPFRFATRVISTGMLSVMMFLGCSKSGIVSDEITGVWKHRDGAELDFSTDGRFTAKSLPSVLLFGPSKGAGNVSGQGKWQIVPVSGYLGPQIKLSFDGVGDRENGVEIPVLIAGSKRSLTLFLWKGEEGGERFEFRKH